MNRKNPEIILHREKASGNYWAWQGDGNDHLESLTIPVLIAPEILKAIIAGNKPSTSLPCAAEQLAAIHEMLKSEQEHDRYHFSDEKISSLVHRVLEHKRGMVTDVIARTREFQQDVLTFLRAFSLMLETVAGANTHGEKAARLRGLMELVESAARKLRDMQFRETQQWSYSMADDVFRCDYPVRYFINNAREAEAKVKVLEAEIEAMRKAS